ncbi:MAG: hypothetical protein RBR02_06240 [Desulfuromonadaceae bacterium]|nr:hypothetical protein [Desulfuromonadaceae bacterium]
MFKVGDRVRIPKTNERGVIVAVEFVFKEVFYIKTDNRKDGLYYRCLEEHIVHLPFTSQWNIGDVVKYAGGMQHYTITNIYADGTLRLKCYQRWYTVKPTANLILISPATSSADDIYKNKKIKGEQNMRGKNVIDLWYSRKMEANRANLAKIESDFRASSEYATIVTPVATAIAKANEKLTKANRPTLCEFDLSNVKLTQEEFATLKSKLADADTSKSIKSTYEEVVALLGANGDTGTTEMAFDILRNYGIIDTNNKIIS